MLSQLDQTGTADIAVVNREYDRRSPRGERKPFAGAFPLIMIALLAPWTFDAVRVVQQGIQTALAPAATCGTEMHILDGVACVARGEPLYPPIDGLPLAFHLYNPLTYLPAGGIGAALGLDLDGLLVAGRMVSRWRTGCRRSVRSTPRSTTRAAGAADGPSPGLKTRPAYEF